jgi:four helix bundle protein
MTHSFRDLEVWQIAMDLVEDCYRCSASFPKNEVYGLGSQLQRSAVSIPANIAEGQQRQHRKEFIQHLSIAGGSLAELETHIEIALRLHYISQEQGNQLINRTDQIGRMLTGLKKSLRRQNDSE